jgi:hypothetical protein
MAQPAERDGNDRGFLLAVLAAASAALFLFLPITILGYTAYLLGAALIGRQVSGMGVAETYAFVGGPAVISVLLMIVPYRLCRAASRRIGHDQSAVIIGGLLTIWHAGVAAYWAWASTEGFTYAPTGDVLWYPLAFGLAAVIITLMVARWWFALVPIGLVLVMGLLLSGVVRGHTVVPPGAQQVEVEVTTTEVRLSPDTVQAGDVYLVLVTPRSSITVTQNELVETDVPTDHSFDLTGCTDAQRAEDRGQVGYCGNVFKVTLSAGLWVSYSTAADGPGQVTARLEVVP